jgi:hypothetical protein
MHKTKLAALMMLLAALAAWTGTGSAASTTRSCGWAVVVSGSQANVLFPDAAATYWGANEPIPPGGYVEIHGQFPHARYMSLATYTSQYQSIDGLHDSQIVPDPGSTNPFVAGGDRTASSRDYTVRIVQGQAPASGRPPNTIYTTSADGSKSGNGATQRILLRIYEGDQGQGNEGGVPLPDITLVTSGGQRTTLPECPDASVPNTGYTETLANAGTGDPSPLPQLGLGGVNPPVWHKFTNFASGVVTASTDNEVTGSEGATVTQQTDQALPEGGFADNPDNKYMTTYFSQDYGQVLAFRAKAPTFPATYDGEPVMGTGQLRYWSFCTNGQMTAYYACRQDDQIPTDASGYYTVVVSTAAARPKNASERCGVAWLPAGAFPQSILILRNMLPDPSFEQAIQNARPGTEEQTLGEYYPHGTYYRTTADFERLGCPAGVG